MGRPSPVVAPDPGVIAIAANPEVDALTIAAVGLDRSIPLRARIELDGLISPEETAAMIARRSTTWRAGDLADARLVGVGLACRGSCAPRTDWSETPRTCDGSTRPCAISSRARPAYRPRRRQRRDARRVAEHLFGAARGVDDVVYLNGGASGIGGGLIVRRDAGPRRRRIRGRIRAEPARHRLPRRPAGRRRRARGRSEPRAPAGRRRAALGRRADPRRGAARDARPSPWPKSSSVSAASSPRPSRTPSTC